MLQCGSFSSKENADALKAKLLKLSMPAYVKTSGTVFKVFVGPKLKRAAADDLAKTLTENKIDHLIVAYQAGFSE